MSSVDQRGSNTVDKDNKEICKASNLFFAFLTGAGIATTAFLLAKKAQKGLGPAAERIIKKCDRAFAELDEQILHQVA